MKKLFSYILLLAMVLSLFAGCNQNEAAPDLTGLEKAKTYLFNLYKDSGVTTTANFDVVGVVNVQGYGKYTVTWSADSDAITFTPNDKMVTVNIPGSPAEEIVYKLTGTISDGNGNSVSVSFDHRVPAGGNLTDGTYVILAGNLTMSSLPQDMGYGYPTANEVTVEGNKVSNHFKADVLTIKKVGDSYTIQDAYGRYFYLKGTYNSFNVSSEIPTDGGHLFTIGKDGDGYTIVNDAMSKTLAYSTSYTSWGCYPELGEDHKSVLTILPATAPATDPTTPSDPTDPSTPSTPSTPSSGMITSPAAGVPYKLSMNNGKNLYFMGVISNEATPWYMKSSESEADAIDVYLEAVTGGYRLYFTINGTKTYLVMYKDGTHYSLKLTTEPSTVYTWNTEHNTLVAMNEDKECFIGTSGTYNTFSCNTMDKVGTSYVAHLFGEGGTTTPEPTTPPTTPPTQAPTQAPTTTPTQPSNPGTSTGNSVTVVSANLGYANQTDVVNVDFNGIAVMTFDVGSNSYGNTPKFYTGGSAIRAYTGNIITFTPAPGITITSITINVADEYQGKTYVVDSEVALTNATLASCQGNTSVINPTNGAANVVLTNNRSNNGQIRMVSIEIKYTGSATGKPVPPTPSEPSTPSTPTTPPASEPSTPSGSMVTSPVAGTAYKMVINQQNKGQTLYFIGESMPNQPWYMKSSENIADAMDVYLEAVTGGYRLYFTVNGTKTYLVMYKDGTHYSLKLTTEPSTVYTWNAEYNTLVAMNVDAECYIGTYSTYTTFSCSQLTKINGSFPAYFIPAN